ncbi:ydiI hotdog fold superfamily [Klebsiella variicola]|nr:ydiI hotdog fold superfamily [Klebsiella variicola]
MIWKRQATLEQLNRLGEGNMVGLLDIRFETFTDDTLEATMPVDSRTQQPFGLLHGGPRWCWRETLGSVAGYLCSEGEQKVVGLEVNANHIRSARGGRVRGVCKALHVGTRHQVWQIEIFDEQSRLCCSSRANHRSNISRDREANSLPFFRVINGNGFVRTRDFVARTTLQRQGII